MADTTGFEPRPGNIEDRRDEFSAYQHLLMALGIDPLDHSDARASGLAPGQYHPSDIRMLPPTGTKLEEDMGMKPITEMQRARALGMSLDPWLKGGGGDEIGKYIALNPNPLEKMKGFPPITGTPDLPVEVIEPSNNEAKSTPKKKVSK